MEFLTTAFYFIVVISVLIAIHEFGHFIAARMTGMRTEVFAIGMGQRVMGFNKITGFTFGSLPKDIDLNGFTDYRISLFPIGGYVKISGMVDESMDTNYEETEPQPWEFRSKNTFQKAFVISAGVLMNMLLAVGIFSYIIFNTGEYVSNTTEIGYVKEGSVADKFGFKEGDEILSINGNDVEDWNGMLEKLTFSDFGDNKVIKLRRNGNLQTLNIEGKEIVKSMVDEKGFGFASTGRRVVVTLVNDPSPASEAGIKAGDTIISVNKQDINSVPELQAVFGGFKKKTTTVEIKRNNDIIAKSVRPNNEGMIGIGISSAFTGPVEHRKYGLFESLAYGIDRTVQSVNLFFGSIMQMIEGTISVKQSIGGPIMIAKSAAQQAEMGWQSFLSFMALLSVSLAIINIAPFPALDGGHLVFILIEGVMGREVSVKIKMAFQQAGIILLFLLMAFIIYLDFTR